MSRRKHRATTDDAGVAFLVLLLLANGYQALVHTSWRTLLVLAVATLTATTLITVWLVTRRRRHARERLLHTEVLALTPRAFEQRVQLLLQDLGWAQVTHVGGAGDGGVDLRGVQDGQHYIVQCKRYKGYVDPSHLRDLAGALSHDRATRALLVTTGSVSERTRAWVGDKPIDIWDKDVLASQMRQAAEAQQDSVRVTQRRQRIQWLLGGLIGLNALALVVAVLMP